MIRNLLWILGIVAALAVGYYFADIVAYVLIAWVLSMLGAPLMVFFRRRIRFRNWRLGEAGAAALTLISFYLILAGVLFLFVPTIVGQARHLASVNYEELGQKLQGPFADLDSWLHEWALLEPGQSLGNRSQEILSEYFKPTMVGDFLGGLISTAGSLVVALGSITFILFFFLKNDSLFMDIVLSIVPDKQERQVRHAVKRSSIMLTRYFDGLVIQTASFTTLVAVTLWILGVPNALLIGVMAGLLNIIPYVGPLLGIVVGCFFTISHYIESDFALMVAPLIKVVLTIQAVQILDNNFIGPYIMSNSVKAHPLEIFIVTLIAAKLGGVVGMIIGIPVYTVLRVIAREFFSEFKLVRRLTGSLED
ncbi:MAG: AI-2E family transporter [Saprospiraceae bacterium]|nr:AI-2E family transporter [Lewinellaceae bacterium]